MERRKLVGVGSYITPRQVSSCKENCPRMQIKCKIDEMDDGRQNEVELFTNESETFPLMAQSEMFLECLQGFWREGRFCDVILSVEKTPFRAHKVVLAACSGYFRDMFISRENSSKGSQQDLAKIPLLGIKSNIVKKIVGSMYSTTLTLSTDIVDDMLSAASFLRIPSVVDACSLFLSKRLCVQNCLRTLQVANLYDLKSLLEDSYSLACANFSNVCKQKDFLKLRYCELQCLLPRQDLILPSELFLFNAIVAWIEAEKSSRITYASRLMRYVRFPLIPEHELVDKVESSSYVCQVPEVGEYVREAVRYHLLPYRRPVLQSPRTQPRTTLNMNCLIGCGGLALKREGTLVDMIYYCDVDGGGWKELAVMPEPRHHHAAAVLGGYLYIAGGDETKDWSTPSDKVWRYDAWENEWLQVAKMKSARESFQMVELDAKLYIVGGRICGNVTVNSVEAYDPVENDWSEVASVSSPRRHIAITTFNGRVYAAGGSNDDLISRRVERYNPSTNTWERRQPLLKPRFSAGMHAIKNNLWLVGGATVDAYDSANGVHGAAEIEIYSPMNNQWTQLKDANSPNGVNIQNISSNQCGTIMCSSDVTDPDSTNFILDVARSEGGSCLLTGKIYLVGGFSWVNRTRLDDVECIDAINEAMSDEISDNDDSQSCGAFSGDLISPVIMATESYKPRHYPLHCTGIACTSLTLHKIPSFALQSVKMCTTPSQSRTTSRRTAGSRTNTSYSSKRSNKLVMKSARNFEEKSTNRASVIRSRGQLRKDVKPTHNDENAFTNKCINDIICDAKKTFADKFQPSGFNVII